MPAYACDSEWAVYDDPQGAECTSLRSKMARCESVMQTCYKWVLAFMLAWLRDA